MAIILTSLFIIGFVMEVMSTGHNDYIIARSSSSSNSDQYTLFQKYSESCPSYYQDVKNTCKYFVLTGSKPLVYENINILTRPVCQIDTNIDTTVDYTYTDYQPLNVCEAYVGISISDPRIAWSTLIGTSQYKWLPSLSKSSCLET